MSTSDEIIKLIKENNIEFVDFRFTDPKGKWQHTCYLADSVDHEVLSEGIMFDGSSISGWKTINESDMILLPDTNTAFVDPFAAQPTLGLFCDVLEPSTGQGYDRDPRSTAKRAETFLKYQGIADRAYFGPELEFFIFDDVRFNVGMNESFVHLDSEEGPYNSHR
ncbi:MAG: glutamine synthetase beta-grasp domain-containing protein, partial [Rickettsiales bacterium]|nr:glutamine synthetase beta-grasp domain-containing protein [Rickettsiales bacterium]